RLVDRLDLLHGHRASRDVYDATIPVLVVLAFPNELRLQLRKRVLISRAVARFLSHSGFEQAARIPSAMFSSWLSVYFRGGGQISPKPSFRHRGTTCKCR